MRLGRLAGVAGGLSNVKIGSRAYVARARSSVLVAMRRPALRDRARRGTGRRLCRGRSRLSRVRRGRLLGSCATGGHRLWWTVEAVDSAAALNQPPLTCRSDPRPKRRARCRSREWEQDAIPPGDCRVPHRDGQGLHASVARVGTAQRLRRSRRIASNGRCGSPPRPAPGTRPRGFLPFGCRHCEAVWSKAVLVTALADSNTGTLEFEQELVEILTMEGDAVAAEAASAQCTSSSARASGSRLTRRSSPDRILGSRGGAPSRPRGVSSAGRVEGRDD